MSLTAIFFMALTTTCFIALICHELSKAINIWMEPYQEKNNVVLFLDDERFPTDCTWMDYGIFGKELKYVIVRTYDEFALYIKNNPSPLGITLDHDIQDFDSSGKEKTGYDCLKFYCDFFEEKEIPIDNLPTVLFHTQNVVGKDNMSKYFDNFKKFKGVE